MPKVFIQPTPERAKFGGIWAIARHFPMKGEEMEVSDEQLAALHAKPGIVVTIIEPPKPKKAKPNKKEVDSDGSSGLLESDQ